MIKLFSVKQKQKEAADGAGGRVPVKKQSAGELRVQKGWNSWSSSIILFFKRLHITRLRIYIRPLQFVFIQISGHCPHLRPLVTTSQISFFITYIGLSTVVW